MKNCFSSGVDDLQGVLLTGYGDSAAFSGDLSVGVDPHGNGGFQSKGSGLVGFHTLKAVVLSLEGGRKGEQDQPLGKISHSAKIHDAVRGIGIGAEHKAASLKAVEHACGKEHIADIYRNIIVQS